MVEKKEGATMTCSSCKTKLICRIKHYPASSNYPEKDVPQWQNDDGSAHYSTNNGKDFTCNIPENSTTTTDNSKQEVTKNKLKTLPPLNEKIKKYVEERTIQLYQINKIIRSTLEEFEPEPYPGMIGQFTKTIKDEVSFVDIEIPDVFDDEKYCSCDKPIPNAITHGKTCQTCLKLMRPTK